MKQYEIDCFEVVESYDRDVTSIAYVSNKKLADLLVDNSPYRTVSPYKKCIIVFDTIEEFNENSKENLRKSGLAKLSPAERQALGLN